MTQILPNLLLKNVSANTVGDGLIIPSDGWRVIKIDGALGSGSITLQTKDQSNDSTWQNVPDPINASIPYSLIQSTQFRVYLGAGMMVRAVLSNSSNASGVYVRIF